MSEDGAGPVPAEGVVWQASSERASAAAWWDVPARGRALGGVRFAAGWAAGVQVGEREARLAVCSFAASRLLCCSPSLPPARSEALPELELKIRTSGPYPHGLRMGGSGSEEGVVG